MTQTLLSPLPLPSQLVLVPFPDDWGRFDCQRTATAAEMVACDSKCVCGATMKHGTVVGRRADRGAPWMWGAVLCRPCDVDLSKADGYVTGADAETNH